MTILIIRDETKTLEETQMNLMLELISLGNSVVENLGREDQQEMQLIVKRLKEIWPYMADVTLTLSGDPISKTEENLQENLRQTLALLLFMAK